MLAHSGCPTTRGVCLFFYRGFSCSSEEDCAIILGKVFKEALLGPVFLRPDLGQLPSKLTLL